MNKLYVMTLDKYIQYIKEQILNTQWFKKACKEKKIVIKYLSKDYFKSISYNIYFKYENTKYYFYKLLLLRFEYKEELENSNHLKLLNINIINETRFNVVKLLLSLQKNFLNTNHFLNMLIIKRADFINNYIKLYDKYLDTSILSKILNNTYFLFNNYIHKLDYLVPKERFIYSIYIKDIINTHINILKSDEQISKLIYKKYNIKLSRRVVCDIRNKYLITRVRKIDKFDSVLSDTNFFSNKKLLNKKNISLLPNNIKGVYELSSNKIEFYPFLQNKVLYIGSSKNIKKRLRAYTTQYAHTKEIQDFIKNGNDLYFRFIRILEYRESERKFINNFIYTHGKLPRLNTQRVL